MLSAEQLAWVAAVFLIAGIVKGTIGMGLPTTSISLLAQGLDPRTAVALLLVPAIVTNVWQVVRAGRWLDSVRGLWPFAAAMIITLWPATQALPSIAVDHLVLGVGLMVVLFAATSLLRAPPRIPPRYDRPAQFAAGAIAGTLGGFTSIWSPPMVVYLLGRGVGRDEFIRFAGFIILVGTLPLTVGYWNAGLFTGPLALSSTLMIVPVLAGFAIGERLRHRMPTEQFRRWVLIFFFVMGLNLVRRALW